MIETSETFLIDSNILIYAFDKADPVKQNKARHLLESCFSGKTSCAVSLQNLSEFYVIITKKIKNPLPHDEAAIIVRSMIEFNGLKKLEVSQHSMLRALDLCKDGSTKYWDVLIAATMLENTIFGIYTENTKYFDKIPGIKTINPFE